MRGGVARRPLRARSAATTVPAIGWAPSIRQPDLQGGDDGKGRTASAAVHRDAMSSLPSRRTPPRHPADPREHRAHPDRGEQHAGADSVLKQAGQRAVDVDKGAQPLVEARHRVARVEDQAAPPDEQLAWTDARMPRPSNAPPTSRPRPARGPPPHRRGDCEHRKDGNQEARRSTPASPPHPVRGDRDRVRQATMREQLDGEPPPRPGERRPTRPARPRRPAQSASGRTADRAGAPGARPARRQASSACSDRRGPPG